MGWFNRKKPTPAPSASELVADFKTRSEAAQVLEERESGRLRRVSDASAAVSDARTWLEEHPKTHSARRGDVRRLINAVESLLEES